MERTLYEYTHRYTSSVLLYFWQLFYKISKSILFLQNLYMHILVFTDHVLVEQLTANHFNQCFNSKKLIHLLTEIFEASE